MKNKTVALRGIYRIANIVEDKHYIGQGDITKNGTGVDERLDLHKSQLRTGNNSQLFDVQKDFTAHPENFRFYIEEYCAPDVDLNVREAYYINQYGPIGSGRVYNKTLPTSKNQLVNNKLDKMKKELEKIHKFNPNLVKKLFEEIIKADEQPAATNNPIVNIPVQPQVTIQQPISFSDKLVDELIDIHQRMLLENVPDYVRIADYRRRGLKTKEIAQKMGKKSTNVSNLWDQASQIEFPALYVNLRCGGLKAKEILDKKGIEIPNTLPVCLDYQSK